MDGDKREIKMTEKGQQYQIGLKRNEVTQSLKALISLSNRLQTLLSENVEIEVVQPTYTRC